MSGDPISTIQVGQQFQLAAFVQDVTSSPNGVAAAYLNVNYNSAFATAAQPTSGQQPVSVFTFAPDFNTSESGDTTTLGTIVDAGAFQGSLTFPADRNPPENPAANDLLWTVPMTATGAGMETFTPLAASNNSSGNFNVLEYGNDNAIDPSEIDFIPGSLTVTSGPPVITVAETTPGANGADSDQRRFHRFDSGRLHIRRHRQLLDTGWHGSGRRPGRHGLHGRNQQRDHPGRADQCHV